MRNLHRLYGVEPKLSAVIMLAALQYERQYPTVQLSIASGLRTAEQQADLISAGITTAKKSKHLTGHAVDIALIRSGVFDKTFESYSRFNDILQEIASQMKIKVVWGGSWEERDGVHFQV